jgi:membrane protein YdbS with pleckstrin-like domain
MNNSKLTPKVQKNLMLALVIIWSLCTVAWIVCIVLDIVRDGAILQLVLHCVCAVGAVACVVMNFRRWRAMSSTEESAEDTLDSTDE